MQFPTLDPSLAEEFNAFLPSIANGVFDPFNFTDENDLFPNLEWTEEIQSTTFTTNPQPDNFQFGQFLNVLQENNAQIEEEEVIEQSKPIKKAKVELIPLKKTQSEPTFVQKGRPQSNRQVYKRPQKKCRYTTGKYQIHSCALCGQEKSPHVVIDTKNYPETEANNIFKKEGYNTTFNYWMICWECGKTLTFLKEIKGDFDLVLMRYKEKFLTRLSEFYYHSAINGGYVAIPKNLYFFDTPQFIPKTHEMVQALKSVAFLGCGAPRHIVKNIEHLFELDPY